MGARGIIAAALLAAAVTGCAGAETGPARSGTLAARIGQVARQGGLAVAPLSVVEDSRCPIGVQCIQAGTVRLVARIRRSGAEAERTLALREPQQVGDVWIALAAACPAPVHGQPLRAGDYRFVFEWSPAPAAKTRQFEC